MKKQVPSTVVKNQKKVQKVKTKSIESPSRTIAKSKFQVLIITSLLAATSFQLPSFVFLAGPAVALLLSLVRSKEATTFSNGFYFVAGFCVSLCIAPFSYFLPSLSVISPDTNFYIFAIVLNYVFLNVVIIQIQNLIGEKLVIHKANITGLVVAILISLNFYKELIDPDKQKYLLNYFIKAGWDNVAHFGIFNQIYLNGANTKVASSNGAEIIGSGYPQHLHIILGWGARAFSPHYDSTQSLYMFVLANSVFFALVSTALFFAIASISGDKLFVFAPALSLIVGVLFYSSATSSYLAGWHTFLFSQLIACLAVFMIYKIQRENFHGQYGNLYVGALLCLLTNIWYLIGLVVLILYAGSTLISALTLKKFALVAATSLPALLTPFYFLYPRVGISALASGGSPGYSWRLFLIASAVAFLFSISPQLLASSKYSIYVLSILFATWSSVFALFLLVQVDSEGATYYLGKLIQGSFVMLISGLAIVLMSKLDLAEFRTKLALNDSKRAVLFSSILSFALLNSLVYLGPGFRDSTDRLHLNANNANIRILLGSSQEAIRLLNVSDYVKNEVTQTLYISTFNTDPNVRLADLWVRVFAGNWTYQSEESSVILNSVSQSNSTSVFEATKKFLSKYPEGKIVMSLDFYSANQEQFENFRDSNFHLVDDFGRNPNTP